MKTLAVPAAHSHPAFHKTCLQLVKEVILALNAFLCIRLSAWVCVTTVWAPTIGYLCLFLEGGAPETWPPRVIGWLATVRSLLWRVLYAGFFRFQLNVECSTLEGHLKCVVFVYVCVCLCLFVSVPSSFDFRTQRSLSKGERTSRAGKMGPETFSVISPRRPPCQFDSICVCRRDLNRKRGGYEHKKQIISCDIKISSHPERNNTFHKYMCVFPVSHKRLLAPCLLFVRGVFCLDVISASLFLSCMHRRRCGLLSKSPFGQKTIVVGGERKKKDVTDCSNVPFQENLCTMQTQKKHKY